MSIILNDVSKVFWSAEKGAILKEWMIYADRSLSQIAKVAEISKTQAAKLTNGGVNEIDPRKLEAIARYLGQDPAQLISYIKTELPKRRKK